jgi:RNA polymerase sigma-70 factor (ECF subfamily)
METAGQAALLLEEAELQSKLQAGDEAAFEAYVRANCGRMLCVARRLLQNEEDAQDVVQEAFLASFQQIKAFKGQARLSTWLHRIVVNAALGRLRSRKRHPEHSIEDLVPHFGEGEHQLDPPAPWREATEPLLESKEARLLVQQCISKLPESYRIVLVFRDIECLDTEETAAALATSPGVVKTRLHRARQALRTLLDPHFRRGDL